MPPKPSPKWQNQEVGGHVWDRRLNEISGLTPAKSTTQGEQVFWAHNDSGDKPRLFVLHKTGVIQKELALKNTLPYDPEDITRGACDEQHPKTRCVILADIGDNRHKRHHLHLYRFADEPYQTMGDTVTPETLMFQYEGGEPSDAEAVFSHPETGELFVMQKRRDGKQAIYKVPSPAPWHVGHEHRKIITLKKVAMLDLSHEGNASMKLVTAADFSPDGRCLSFLTYRTLLTYCLERGEPWQGIEHLLGGTQDRHVPALLLQAEAMTWGHGGKSIWITSERNPSPMLRVLP